MSLLSVLGLETSPASVQYYGRTVRVLTNHVSIDPSFVEQHLFSDYVRNLAATVRDRLGPQKRILLGIDDLDWQQGISLKMLAFECFLQVRRCLNRGMEGCSFVF